MAPLDLSRWRGVPTLLIVVGGALALIGFFVNRQQFAFSWLVAFMFCLSICLGSLFLVLAHHLFDAGWSVPIRRTCENICSMLFPWMLILWIPVGLAFPKVLYPWFNEFAANHGPDHDHALIAKQPLFSITGFYVVSLGLFAVWFVL